MVVEEQICQERGIICLFIGVLGRVDNNNKGHFAPIKGNSSGKEKSIIGLEYESYVGSWYTLRT